MPEPYDITFGKNAVAQKLLSAQQGNAAIKAQTLLKQKGISKSLADIAVEAGFLKREAATKLIEAINGSSQAKHPGLKASLAGLRDEAAVQTAIEEGRITSAQKEECEKLGAELENLGVKRGLADLLADKGYATPEPAEEGTKAPSGVRGLRGTATTKKSDRTTGVTSKAPPGRKPTQVKRGTEPRKPRPASPADVEKKKKMLLLGGTGAGVVVLIVILILFMGQKSGSKSAKEPERDPIAKKEPEKKETKKEDKKEEIKDTKKSLDSELVDPNARKKFEEEQKKRDEARKKEAAAKKTDEDKQPDENPKTDETPKPKGDEKERLAAYEKRKAERVAGAQKRLDDARAEIGKDKKAEAEKMKAIAERMKGMELTVRLKSGLELTKAVIHEITRSEVDISFQFEGATAQQTYALDLIDNRSYVRILEAVYKSDGAAGWYEVGRGCIARKLWKDAQRAFDECVKLDASFKERAPDLGKILKNEGAFKGSSKKVGADGILVTYDFADPDQLKDFVSQSGGKASIENGELKISGKSLCLWSLKDTHLNSFEFEKEVDVEMTAIADGAGVVFGPFFDAQLHGYLLVVGPQGTKFSDVEDNGPKEISSKPESKLPQGSEVKLRFTARDGDFKAYVNGQEVFAAKETKHAKGSLVLGSEDGSLRIKKLIISGKAQPDTINRLFAEAEILVRRTLEGDLGGGKKKKKKKGADNEEVDDVTLSVEDDYFMDMLDEGQRRDYDIAKYRVLKTLQRGSAAPDELEIMRPTAYPDGFPAPYYWRGMLNQTFGLDEDASRDFNTALKICKDFYEAEIALGDLALNDRDMEKAKGYMKEALKKSPDYAGGWALQGYLEFITGGSKASLADLELALKLDPGNPEARQYLKTVTNLMKGPQHLGCTYIKEFPHYIIMTDISMEKTKLYGERLEAAYKYYADTFKEFFTEVSGRRKPRVAIFFTREAYLTYGELTVSSRQEFTLGYFHPLYNELLLFEDADIEETLHTLYHEAFHQFVNMMATKTPPYWYNEGVAEYMGSIHIEKGKKGFEISSKAEILDGRLRNLKDALQVKLVFKFSDIMMETPGQFYGGGPTMIAIKYAQAWSMIHFFYEFEGGKYRSLIEAYFRALKGGGDPKEAYDAAFGKSDMDAVQKEWQGYVNKLEPRKKT